MKNAILAVLCLLCLQVAVKASDLPLREDEEIRYDVNYRRSPNFYKILRQYTDLYIIDRTLKTCGDIEDWRAADVFEMPDREFLLKSLNPAEQYEIKERSISDAKEFSKQIIWTKDIQTHQVVSVDAWCNLSGFDIYREAVKDYYRSLKE